MTFQHKSITAIYWTQFLSDVRHASDKQFLFRRALCVLYRVTYRVWFCDKVSRSMNGTAISPLRPSCGRSRQNPESETCEVNWKWQTQDGRRQGVDFLTLCVSFCSSSPFSSDLCLCHRLFMLCHSLFLLLLLWDETAVPSRRGFSVSPTQLVFVFVFVFSVLASLKTMNLLSTNIFYGYLIESRIKPSSPPPPPPPPGGELLGSDGNYPECISLWSEASC